MFELKGPRQETLSTTLGRLSFCPSLKKVPSTPRLISALRRGIRLFKEDQSRGRFVNTTSTLCDDEALITPSAMTAKLLASQIQQYQKAIQEFESSIASVMKQHPDAHLFTSLRGAGPALAPRLLCAFGSRRDRWRDADSLASFSGIAPVTKQSGKQRQVHRRFACPKYLRQTFHEFADSARIYCPWSKARYKMLRDHGMKHHAAIRKIARSWIRILFRVWQTRTPSECDRYIAKLKLRCPEISRYLAQEN